MTSIKGAIFDVDGTLLDSMPAWNGVAAELLRCWGAVPRPDLNEELRPLGGHQLPEYFQAEYGIKASAEEIHNAINGLLEEFYRDTAPLKDGVLELLEELRTRGVKMCVLTATDRCLVEPALRRCGILEYFGRIFTCGEEQTGKDGPEVFMRAAAFLGTALGETFVFEDALYAIKTASEAGFQTVAVYDNAAHDQQDEIKRVADYYFESLRDCSL